LAPCELDCEFCARKSIVIRPNWSPLACGRNTICILAVQHSGGNAGGDPHELLELLDPGGHRHALRRRIEAEQHVDLFLLDQTDASLMAMSALLWASA